MGLGSISRGLLSEEGGLGLEQLLFLSISTTVAK